MFVENFIPLFFFLRVFCFEETAKLFNVTLGGKWAVLFQTSSLLCGFSFKFIKMGFRKSKLFEHIYRLTKCSKQRDFISGLKYRNVMKKKTPTERKRLSVA